jgi:DNA-directed RNA polymerase specialized sigma24 family protein
VREKTKGAFAMSTQYSNAISSTGSTVHDGGANAAAFEQFLFWLGPDPESAGKKYELIRDRLIMMFRARRCVFAEDLADTTFERVARKLTDLTTEYTGDPARYFYGVAKKVYLEYQHEIMTKRMRVECSLTTSTEDPDLENMLKQLDNALSAIPKSDRELILNYYTGSGRNKINHRRVLAKRFGLPVNALRLRVFRIRREIKNHILQSPSRCCNGPSIYG